MAKKSSKTAHVLNLISPSKAEEPALETPAVQNTASDASPAEIGRASCRERV